MMFRSRPGLVVAACAVTVFLAMGSRQSFGLFLVPVTSDLGIGRETFSLAIALQNLIFGVPLLAMLADAFGSRPVVLGGALLYCVALVLLSWITSPLGLYLTLGVGVGVALSAVGYVVVLGAVAQVVPAGRRGAAFGVVAAAGSLGMFGVIPGVQWLLSSFGWQGAAGLMALAMATILLAAAFLPGGPEREEDEASLGLALRAAGRHPGYWFLTSGFFVCGFHVSFVATHLPAFLTDSGLAPAIGATALSMIGLFNLFGTSLFGWLGDRYPKKILLSAIYLSRAIVISLFLLLPLTATTALVFGALIGFLWLATVPLTSGIVGQIFGVRYMSSLYGIVFLSHQVGAFWGVWLGGRVFDLTGSYQPVWVLSILLGLVAMALHLPINEERIGRAAVRA